MSARPLLFLDANQYLDLYRLPRWKQALEMVEAQKNHIFVTQQIVDEVNRRKVSVVASFLADALKKMELVAMPIPDHVLNSTNTALQALGNKLQNMRQEVINTTEELKDLALHIVGQVSRGADEVSKGLAPIFSKATPANDYEMKRAQERKMRGNPPGKTSDPLGDQLTWEQLLSKCNSKPKLWILTRDSDYATKHGDTLFLNALLYQDLARFYQSEPEVFCFDTIGAGLKHFSETTVVEAKKLPSAEETEQIKKEQESLPPLAWLDSRFLEAMAAQIPKFDSRILEAIAAQTPKLDSRFLEAMAAQIPKFDSRFLEMMAAQTPNLDSRVLEAIAAHMPRFAPPAKSGSVSPHAPKKLVSEQTEKRSASLEDESPSDEEKPQSDKPPRKK